MAILSVRQRILNFDQLTGNTDSLSRWNAFVDTIRTGPTTPSGFRYIYEYGPVMNNANSNFLIAIDAVRTGDESKLDWVVGQMNYILGGSEDTPGPEINGVRSSYIVGYGASYPTKPRHKAASCDPHPATCDFAQSVGQGCKMFSSPKR